MTMATGERTYQFMALTDLWTGDVNGKTDRLISTGLLGSIRWWFEILVRSHALGGSACSPNPTDIKTKCEDRNHCVVCELFGCTGWARKFRFEILNEKGEVKPDQIKQNKTFSLRFTPLRPICDEEWALLDATLRLIAEYGAIGGKTVFKPTDESNRASKLHHKDYGLVKLLDTSRQFIETDRDNLAKYLSKWRKLNHGEFAWASLQYFWCVNGKHLTRKDSNKSSFNQVLGRREEKKQGQQFLAPHNDGIAKWLAGSNKESKKVFSFKSHARTFGFVKPNLLDFHAIKQRLSNVWGQNGWDFLTEENIIDKIFAKEDIYQ